MLLRSLAVATLCANGAWAQEQKVQIILGGPGGAPGESIQIVGGPGGAPPALPAGFKFPPPRPGDMIMPLLEMRELQNELKLNDEEKAAVGLLKSEIVDGDKAFVESVKDMEPREWGPKMQDRQKEIAKLVEETLGEKYARYKQIRLQLGGLANALMADKEVQEKLGFTSEQREKMMEELRPRFDGKQRFEFKPPAPGEGPPDFAKLQAEMEKNIEKMQSERNEKALALLTDEQKAKWKELTGAEVKFKMPRPKMPTMRFGGPPPAGLAAPPGSAPAPAPPPAEDKSKQ